MLAVVKGHMGLYSAFKPSILIMTKTFAAFHYIIAIFSLMIKMEFFDMSRLMIHINWLETSETMHFFQIVNNAKLWLSRLIHFCTQN
jgi:hypothetical protein